MSLILVLSDVFMRKTTTEDWLGKTDIMLSSDRSSGSAEGSKRSEGDCPRCKVHAISLL